MRRASGPGTARSTISGGYTDQMLVPPKLPSEGGPLFEVTAATLDPAAVAAAVARSGDGAVATFVGPRARPQRGADGALARLRSVRAAGVEGLRADRGGSRGEVARRADGDPSPDGRVAIGEASVAIAAASPHRADAFAACRYAIERVKQIAPIWKHEHFEGGDVWIEGATADPSDDAARLAALERACT